MSRSIVSTEIVKDHIAILTINRPETSNALSIHLLNALDHELASIDQNKSIYCTIITGAGQRAFCAGADLKERREMTNEQVIQTVQLISTIVNKVASMRMPTIAAINGAAYGGGLELALGCDLRVAKKEAKIGLTETALAIIPGAGGTQRLARLIGISRAKEMIFTGEPISSETALSIGLVNHLFNGDTLLEKTIDLASRIIKNGPIALELSKNAIDTGFDQELTSGLAIEHHYYKKTLHTKDRLEGLNAFKEKRKPVYRGE